MFLSYKGSTEKSLAGHLLKDGNRLEEGVPGQCGPNPCSYGDT